ncbi:hypothetical protein VTK73DRAFT_7451 [Phialemonium thermophilum]|uniref:Secreted protein n=1 Tax=Phialemonium thermophilum TaxID=223376 RepID=A0ABR3WE83_9PEZI
MDALAISTLRRLWEQVSLALLCEHAAPSPNTDTHDKAGKWRHLFDGRGFISSHKRAYFEVHCTATYSYLPPSLVREWPRGAAADLSCSFHVTNVSPLACQ